jgi:hypothetical protein
LCCNGEGYTGCVIFRATEACLNYIEACYELNGSLDAKARQYWTAIRKRAGVDTDIDKTIAATVILTSSPIITGINYVQF